MSGQEMTGTDGGDKEGCVKVLKCILIATAVVAAILVGIALTFTNIPDLLLDDLMLQIPGIKGSHLAAEVVNYFGATTIVWILVAIVGTIVAWLWGAVVLVVKRVRK